MIELDGQQFSLAEVGRVARGAEGVRLAAAARARMEASRRTVERIVEEGRVVYGVNTGFGKLSDITIPADELRELQLNLVRSHACGVGPALSEEETRAMLLLRANVLALGYSGARAAVAETLLLMLERGVHPVIPEKGSVGASGDLAPLAHLALVCIGEGEDRVEVAGTGVGPKNIPHLVHVWGQDFYLPFADHLAIFRYADQPGMIGRVGNAFGEHGVNIVSAAVGATEGEREAVMALTTDAPVPTSVIEEIAAQDGFFVGRAVDL